MKTLPYTFEQGKQIQDALTLTADNASKALRAIIGDERGPMGLTPDHIKSSPEYQAALSAYDGANSRLRAFNGPFVKQFNKQIVALRQATKGY